MKEDDDHGIRNKTTRTERRGAALDTVYGRGKKSDELIGRLASIAIEKKRESLTAKAFTADRIKTDAPDIFETIDKIGRSIEEKKKIAFQYIDYLPDKTLILRHDKKEYKVSPMVMIWNDDRYYARCIDPDKPI